MDSFARFLQVSLNRRPIPASKLIEHCKLTLIYDQRHLSPLHADGRGHGSVYDYQKLQTQVKQNYLKIVDYFVDSFAPFFKKAFNQRPVAPSKLVEHCRLYQIYDQGHLRHSHDDGRHHSSVLFYQKL